jgi:6-carboxyhexanoate--CoA ligase
MRASKAAGSRKELHVSGAEGIYDTSEINLVIKKYTDRALSHPRGNPDKIALTIEELKQKPTVISSLPVTTLKCSSYKEASSIAVEMLLSLAVSKKAITKAFKILTAKKTMRGASLITMQSGKRVEPDKERGVRVSRLGIQKTSRSILSRRLSKMDINNDTVKEALTLASKAALHPDIIAEVCISDDPDYTTGYIASKKLGYLRIPNIKNYGDMNGGRVFFIKETSDILGITDYLEKTPVIIK